MDVEEKNRPPVSYKVVEVPLRWETDVNLPTHILRGFVFRQASGQGLKALLRKEHFDIVNFNNQFSASHIPLVKSYNLPVAYTVHNPLWYNSQACQSFWQRLKFFQDLKAMQKADAIICLNNVTRLNLTHEFKIPSSKIAVIPLAIDESWFTDIRVSEAIRNKCIPNEGPIVLNVARIAAYKNQLTLAKAIPLVAREIPNVRFLFVGPIGDKSYARRVYQTISEAGVARNAVFLDEIPYADLPQLYSLCKVFVAPSESEAFGVVVLEAMASGKATVASDIETFQEMLGGGRGITVPAFDYEALADAIISLLQDDPLREEMGQRAKEHVRLSYTWNSVAKKIAQVYGQLIK